MKKQKISTSNMMDIVLKLSKALEDDGNTPFEVSMKEVENNSIDVIFLLPPSNNQTQNWIPKERLKSLYDKLKDGGSVACAINGIGSIPKLRSYALNLGFKVLCSIEDNMLILEKGTKKKLLKKAEQTRILILRHPFILLCKNSK